jgi:predicted DNA-binding transcriptional regulator AlpA
MGEHREGPPRGNQGVDAQGADRRAAGRDEGFQDGSGSRSGATIDDDRLITVAQIVKLTGYSEESIRRWIRKGALPIERVGPYGRVRVRSSVLRRLFPT